MVRGFLFLAAVAFTLVGPLVYAGPQLASDLQVGGRWVLDDDLAIKESKCTRWYYLVSTCHIEYVARRDPSRVGGTLNYLVFGSWSGERARLLRATTDRNRIGTTLGLEHMQQRVISFSVFLLLLAAFLLTMIRFGLSASRTSQPLEPDPKLEEPALAAGVRPFGRRREESAKLI
jgi:hypothetical protein